MSLKFKKFTGGIFETNCFFLEKPGGNVLIDAPQGAAEEFANEKIDLLLLTHGHFDHVVDAAEILRRHGCRCGIHADSLPLVNDREAFRKFGFALEIEPIQPDLILAEGPAQDLGGWVFDLLHVPGHCPGSLCFWHRESGNLFGGDVLFRGGVGRWDLPGGDQDLLFRGIREKLYPLPEETVVHPGHGPSTTIAQEKSGNPYVRI
jgi:hydroxyacylglutathione hydrolase